MPLIPIGPCNWLDDATGNLKRATPGAPTLNYLTDGGSWDGVACDWVPLLDNSWEVARGNHRARAYPDGRCEISWVGAVRRHIIGTQTTKLIRINRATHAFNVLANAAMPTVMAERNKLTMADVFPGVDKRITYEHDCYTETFIFRQAARDALASAGPWAGYALGTATRLDLSRANVGWRNALGPIAIDSTGIDTAEWMEAHDQGQHVVGVAGGGVLWSGSGIPKTGKVASQIPVRTWLARIGTDIYLVELFDPVAANGLPPGDVWHNATFGNQNMQTSTTTLEDKITGGVFAPASNGDFSSTGDGIQVYLDFSGATAIYYVKCAIYQWNGGTNPAKLMQTAENMYELPSADGWGLFAPSANASISSGVAYCLCAWANSDPTNACDARLNVSTGNSWRTQTLTYGTWPDPLGGSTVNNYIVSIYAVYTESAAVIPKGTLPMMGVGL